MSQFIKDVNNQDTLVLFRKFLAKEMLNSMLHMVFYNWSINEIFFVGGSQKKVFGKRLVYLNKLLDDLGFWIEAQK